MIGDIAQNLRSALDHVVWQLVLANGGTPKPGGGGTQFPILAEETRHGSLAVRTVAGGVSPAALKIIEAAQPYSTAADRYGSAPAIVRHISNTDKHREPAVVHRVITGTVSWSGTGDMTRHWSAPLKTANPTVDHVELLLAEVPEVLGGRWREGAFRGAVGAAEGRATPQSRTAVRNTRSSRVGSPTPRGRSRGHGSTDCRMTPGGRTAFPLPVLDHTAQSPASMMESVSRGLHPSSTYGSDPAAVPHTCQIAHNRGRTGGHSWTASRVRPAPGLAQATPEAAHRPLELCVEGYAAGRSSPAARHR